MDLKFWKHKKTGRVISDDCLTKIPPAYHSSFEETAEEQTHRVESDEDNVLTSFVIGEELGSLMSFDTGSYTGSDMGNSSGVEFGGGSFGGGGASGDW